MNEVCFVGDRSSSMASMGYAPWKGARDWANEQAQEARKNGHDTRITVVCFDYHSERVIDSVSAANWREIDSKTAQIWMSPRGCTRLYDTAIAGENEKQDSLFSRVGGPYIRFVLVGHLYELFNRTVTYKSFGPNMIYNHVINWFNHRCDQTN